VRGLSHEVHQPVFFRRSDRRRNHPAFRVPRVRGERADHGSARSAEGRDHRGQPRRVRVRRGGWSNGPDGGAVRFAHSMTVRTHIALPLCVSAALILY
jgi:hypothetical protein